MNWWLNRFDFASELHILMLLCMCRPLSEDELRVNTPVVISCHENRREVCAVQNIANKQIDRTFMFDKVLFAILFSFPSVWL